MNEIQPERIAEMWQTARLYGSANCWTGTSGKLATMIVELLKEREERNGYYERK